jgi:hypothetical protein
MGLEVDGVAASGAQKAALREELGAAEYKAPRTEAADFTLTAANHANRRTDCTKGTAQAVTWNTGHGMVDGDCGRLMQVGAGAITITKDGGFSGGELKLATGVASATTVNDGDVLDWEYDATGERLLITYRSAEAAAGGSTGVTFERLYTAASPAPLSTNNVKLARWIVERARLVAGWSIRIAAQVNTGGSTDSISSTGFRAGVPGTAYSSLTTLMPGPNIAAASHGVMELILTIDRDDPTLLVCYAVSSATATSAAITTINTLDIDTLPGDLEIAIGCNVSTTDRPFVQGAMFNVGQG